MTTYCKCGCGGEIIEKPWHKWRGLPSYLHGHCKNTLGRKHSEESKEKNRLAHLGKPAWNKGLTGIYSEETLQKIKDARSKQVMKKGRKHTDESKEKTRVAHFGKVQTEESNKRRSLSLIGKSKSMTHRINIGLAKKGERNPGWNGGSSFLPYSQDWTDDLRDAVRKRDKYRCRLCNRSQDEFKTKLDVHHIDYDKENCDPNNLITLCKSCHIKTNRNREKWEIYFKGFFSKQPTAIAAALS